MVTTNFAPMSNKSWTSKELETLITLRNDGFAYKDIANQLGRTEKSVQVKMAVWNKSMAQMSERAIEIIEEPFNISALVDDKPVRAKPKYYLRHVTFDTKEQAKALGAKWDGMCWFIPDNVTGEAREVLTTEYGPVFYGNHSRKGKGQWDAFTSAELDDINPKAQSKPDPGRAHVQAKPKRVTQKEAQPVVESTLTDPKVTTAVDTNVFTIRIPKRLVWGVLVSVLVVAAWYVGKNY
tara:strand:- start:2624 stop:3334 length:711 start_codon:yes stop_codon:yes gene_type:complete